MPFLELLNLTKKYQNRIVAVDNMSLTIEEGEFLVLLGPSGCGKTTTMRMIAGLEDVTEGEINLKGKSLKGKAPKDRGVSMIFQSYAVWPHMTVYQNIAYALKLRKLEKSEIRRRVEEAAEMANITEYLDRNPSQLSGGQRQRVAVARAMAVEPELFLMDEPLSNLDAKLRVAMRTDLKKVHEKLGSTTIFVTHDQAEAMSLADRIVVMNMGVIEQIGTPNQIYHDCETVFVANFIGSPPTNFIDVTIEVEGDQVFATHGQFRVEVTTDVKEALGKYAGKAVIMGIRPENFTINETDSLFDAVIHFVEPQGSHTIMVVDLGDKQIKLVSSKYFNLRVGDTIKVGINQKSLFFDKDTEKRIR